MPLVFGEMVQSVEEIVRAFERYGDRVRGSYRACYRFDEHTRDPYGGVRLERPESLAAIPADVVYPWEQIFLSAAACAGSDYPMLAAHFGIPLARVDYVVEGDFDPRGQFDGLAGFHAPRDARHCFRSLHLVATLVSNGPSEALARIHTHILAHNMVLNALRGVPRTDEMRVVPPGAIGDTLGDGREIARHPMASMPNPT